MKKTTYVSVNGKRHLYYVAGVLDSYGRNELTGHYGCTVALKPATSGDVACSCRSTLSYSYARGGPVFQAAVDRAKELEESSADARADEETLGIHAAEVLPMHSLGPSR